MIRRAVALILVFGVLAAPFAVGAQHRKMGYRIAFVYDHGIYAMWLGSPVPLKLNTLRRTYRAESFRASELACRPCVHTVRDRPRLPHGPRAR